MTSRDRIIDYLQNNPEGIDDDDLAKVLKLSFRQEANKHCRELEKEGLISRRQHRGKINNFWLESKTVPILPLIVEDETFESPQHADWYWEGNVQDKVIQHLKKQGFEIISSADTSSHQTGIDITARKADQELWVTVKGYPHGTPKTNPIVQAGHYFKDAIFDVIQYRDAEKNVNLAVALPDFGRYHRLAGKITWFKAAANYKYYWVNENGELSIE